MEARVGVIRAGPLVRNRAMTARMAAALLAGGLAACASLLSFDIDSSGRSTIPAGAGGGLLGGLPGFSGFGSMSFAQSSAFQNNNTNKDHVSECRLKRLTLKVVTPAGADLSFLSKIDFFIEAPGLQKVHIAGKSPLPAGATSVDLDLDDLDIAPYARSDTFSITTQASGRAPAQSTTIEAALTLNVHASVL
jgi:hypothetical protein